MSRAHVEFICPKDLSWAPAVLPKSTGGARQKVLSMDWDTKAASLYMQLDPGWSRPRGYYLANTEIYVLEGELTVGERTMGPGFFHRVPKRLAVGPFETSSGATLLYFREGPPNYAVSERSRRGDIQEKEIFLDTKKMEWEQHTINGKPTSLTLKRLYWNPDTDVYSRIVLREGVEDKRVEHHPFVEEGYLLEGDMDWCYGNMDIGAYYYRPPLIQHGHAKANPGPTLWLIHGGEPETVFHTDAEGNPMNYDPISEEEAPVFAEPLRFGSAGDWTCSQDIGNPHLGHAHK